MRSFALARKSLLPVKLVESVLGAESKAELELKCGGSDSSARIRRIHLVTDRTEAQNDSVTKWSRLAAVGSREFCANATHSGINLSTRRTPRSGATVQPQTPSDILLADRWARPIAKAEELRVSKAVS